MLEIKIPGYADLFIEHLVLDYNGTIAVDGIPLPGVLEILSELSRSLNIHVVTADTHGSVHDHLQLENISVFILEEGNQCEQKKVFVTRLGASKTVAIGNGYNDHLMLKEAIVGIAVLQKEGLSYEALANSDLVFSSIIDALECLRYPIRLIASLRR
jgi:soluble P-type ATPase